MRRESKGTMKFFWAIVGIASMGAGAILAFTFSEAESAVQEAAGAALAIAVVGIPYCLARAIQEFDRLQ